MWDLELEENLESMKSNSLPSFMGKKMDVQKGAVKEKMAETGLEISSSDPMPLIFQPSCSSEEVPFTALWEQNRLSHCKAGFTNIKAWKSWVYKTGEENKHDGARYNKNRCTINLKTWHLSNQTIILMKAGTHLYIEKTKHWKRHLKLLTFKKKFS